MSSSHPTDSRPLACDPELLRASLDERLTDAQEEGLSRHLSTCEACREQLERLAAEERVWSQVSTALQLGARGEGVAPEAQMAAPSSSAADRDEFGESPADFAVDFLEPASSSSMLGRLGEIDILQIIGRGGMGVVLKGFQPELNRFVAVKVLAPHLAASSAARKRFGREAQAAAAVMHPNVMPILAVNSTRKLPYLVMPFVGCESLQQRLDHEGAFELVDILRIGSQTANGLAAAHAQGLVHRDVKPANILLERGVDRVLLTDFGLARAVDDASLTRSGVIAGTPQYMSPEQARGEPLDPRSDLFCLGSVLYALATGRPPFRAESTYGILRRITDTPARPIREVNPQMPEWLEVLVQRLHAKEPAARFASAGEVARILEQCLAHLQQPLATPLPESLRPVPRRRAWVGRLPRRLAFAAVLVLVTGSASWWVWKNNPSSPPKPEVSTATMTTPTPNVAPQETPVPPWDDPLVAEEIRDLAKNMGKVESDLNSEKDGMP